MRNAIWLALALAALLAPAACAEDRPACYVGEHAACSCGADEHGYMACLPGARYGDCVCDGTTPGLDGSFEDITEIDAAPSAKLPFMSACTTNEECETGNCHLFSQQGSFCTKTCTTVEDCPAPSSGCNNRGLCKAP